VTYAVIFDCDGVLVNTEDLATASWRKLLARYGHELTDEESRTLLGKPDSLCYRQFAASVALPAEAVGMAELDALLAQAFAAEIAVYEDTLETLDALRAGSVPIGLATNSSRRRLERTLELTGVAEYFDAVVSADDVPSPKPAPDIYLEAARRLGVPPERCIAIEDSTSGVTAALAAGMRVVAVTRPHTVGILDATGATVVQPQIAIAALRELMR
jgi:HAD superfamily hydrolase (TIGR01509 family)